MMRIGVLWDMDGVLVDTEEFHYKAWARACDQYHIPYSYEFFHKTFGMNNKGLLTELLGETPSEELLSDIGALKERYYRDSVRGHLNLLPGVKTLLDRFSQENARQAIASSAPKANIDLIVDELNIGPYFKAVVSAADLPGKPDPAVFLEAARRLGCEPVRCLVIEDAVVGVEAAKRAGMACLAVANTYPAAALKEADLVVENLQRVRPESLDGFLRDISTG